MDRDRKEGLQEYEAGTVETVEKAGREWAGTPLDAEGIKGQGIERIVVEYEEGEEVLTPLSKGRFGSYDLYDAAHYIHALSGRISRGQGG